MDWKKILKRLYGAGDSSHGNIGVLPEKGKGPSYPPKLQTKMHVDINGKEHDMDEYNSGWVMRTSRVRYELRKHVNEDRKQAVSFRRHLRMNENIDDLFGELTKEQKQAKLAEWSCKVDVLTVMLNAVEDDLENRLSNQFKFREFNEFKDEFSNLVFEFNQLDLKLKLTQMH